MKIDPRNVEAFLRDPGGIHLVLFHGTDAGLAGDRVASLTRRIAGSLDDPFLVVDLMRDRIGALREEMAASSLTGGRRVIRCRDVGDQALASVTLALGTPGPGLAILEAGDLPARSKLRTFLDQAPGAATIACNPVEGQARRDTIKDLLKASGISADDAALSMLNIQLGNDRVLMRGEIEKLALSIGGSGVADLAAVEEIVVDLASLSLDDALFAASSGDVAGLDRAIGLAMAEGVAAVQLLRTAASHFQRIHAAALAVQAGASAADAMRQLRPPVFFRRTRSFAWALEHWPISSIVSALTQLGEAERLCKRTGFPPHAVAHEALLRISRHAATFSRMR